MSSAGGGAHAHDVAARRFAYGKLEAMPAKRRPWPVIDVSGSSTGGLATVVLRRYSEFRYAIKSDICCAVNRGQASFFWFMRSNMRGRAPKGPTPA